MVAEVGGARERQRMALHPGQHLVDLAHFPRPGREPAIGEERVRFVEDQEGPGIARLGKRRRNLLLGPADPHRHQVRGALLHDLDPHPLGEVAHERALPRSGRSLQAERHRSGAPVGKPVRERNEVGVGMDEPGIETLRHTLRGTFPREHAGEASHATPHRVEPAAVDELRRGGHPRGDPRRHVVVECQRMSVALVRLDAVPCELPRPDPGPHPRRRLAELDREPHAPQHRHAGLARGVGGPQGGHRALLEHPVQVHLRALGPKRRTRRANEGHHPERSLVREQVLHLVEEEDRMRAVGEQALGEAKLLEPLPARGLAAIVIGFPDGVEGHAEPSGKGPAELRLPRPGLPVHEDVDPLGPGPKRAAKERLDVVARLGDVIEVRPLELPGGRRVEQKRVRVVPCAGGTGRQSMQPVDDRDVSVFVDRDEPRSHERSVRLEAREESRPPDAEEARKRGTPHVEEPRQSPEAMSFLEDRVEQVLDDRIRPVPEHDLEDCHVGARELHLATQATQPRRQSIRPDSAGSAVFTGGEAVSQRVPLVFRRTSLGLPAPCALFAELDERAPGRQQLGVLRDPVEEFFRLRAASVKAPDGIGETGENEMLFVRGEHGFFLRRDQPL